MKTTRRSSLNSPNENDYVIVIGLLITTSYITMAEPSVNATNSTTGGAWFPSGEDGWRVDAVTLALFAIVGHSKSEEFTRAVTASPLVMLPRIVPAMQLLDATRPDNLPREPAKVVGVYSGLVIGHVGYFANALHPLESVPPLGFKVYKITHRKVVESDGPETSRTPELGRGLVKPVRPIGVGHPVKFVLSIAFLLTIGLIITAGVWRDGPALVALILMCLASSLLGLGSNWRPKREPIQVSALAPPGDIVIRSKENAIIVVQCTEMVARELYGTGLDECKYRVPRLFSGAVIAYGIMLLMLSILMLGNCSWHMQVLISAAYIFLNLFFWVAAFLPARRYWDMSRYIIETITPDDAKDAHHSSEQNSREDAASFTRTLWYAIRETKHTSWATRGEIVPDIPMWKQWLQEAEEQAISGNRAWPFMKRRYEIVEEKAAGYRQALGLSEDGVA
jgi:hypothetical protein